MYHNILFYTSKNDSKQKSIFSKNGDERISLISKDVTSKKLISVKKGKVLMQNDKINQSIRN